MQWFCSSLLCEIYCVILSIWTLIKRCPSWLILTLGDFGFNPNYLGFVSKGEKCFSKPLVHNPLSKELFAIAKSAIYVKTSVASRKLWKSPETHVMSDECDMSLLLVTDFVMSSTGQVMSALSIWTGLFVHNCFYMNDSK